MADDQTVFVDSSLVDLRMSGATVRETPLQTETRAFAAAERARLSAIEIHKMAVVQLAKAQGVASEAAENVRRAREAMERARDRLLTLAARS